MSGDDEIKVVDVQPPKQTPAKKAKSSNGSDKKSEAAIDLSKEKNGTDGDAYTLKVKKDYVLEERSAVLAAVPSNGRDGRDGGDKDNKDKQDARDSRDSRDARDNRDSRDGHDSRDKKSKKRGQNKKRPRDQKISHEDKACLAIVRGETCPYGDKCKFNHDLKCMLADRPEDIEGVDGYLKEGGCPGWRLKGYCHFGIMCRFGSCHLNMSTGENLRKNTDKVPAKKDEEKKDKDVATEVEKEKTAADANSKLNSYQHDVLNIISKDVTIQLRKNQYPFVTKRHWEEPNYKPSDKFKSKQKQHKTKPQSNESKDGPPVVKATSPATPPTTTDTPLPPKTRKLIDFSNKVYIAPLTTVGNLPFRRILKSHGADITCGEMALADQLLQGKASEWALLKRHPSEDVFGVQIAAGHADQYTRIAEVLANEMKKEEGFDIDFVDLNLGCPIDLVCDKGAGACLMLRDRKLRGSLEGMTGVLGCPLTVKMRTGWDESKPIAHNLVQNIQKWGIDGIGAVMVHGRSRLQRYSRQANWDYISQIAHCQTADLSQIPVIGNGDIFSYTDYEDKILNRINDDKDDSGNPNNLIPCAMLGRGALIKPWLPTEIKERRHWDISATERLEMLKDFTKFGLEHWGSDQQGVNNTRRFVLEWLSFLHRYVPVGLLEVVPQQMNMRPPLHMCGRSDLETLMLSKNCADWIKISEMLLGPVSEGFQFEPKHKANSYK